MRLLYWIVVALVGAVLALFAASNREPVLLALWPLPFVVDLPLYVAVLGASLIGFATGAFLAWSAGHRRRRELRRRGRRIAALESELVATQARLPAADDGAGAVAVR
jgi:uncharacterized integral membrane protein